MKQPSFETRSWRNLFWQRNPLNRILLATHLAFNIFGAPIVFLLLLASFWNQIALLHVLGRSYGIALAVICFLFLWVGYGYYATRGFPVKNDSAGFIFLRDFLAVGLLFWANENWRSVIFLFSIQELIALSAGLTIAPALSFARSKYWNLSPTTRSVLDPEQRKVSLLVGVPSAIAFVFFLILGYSSTSFFSSDKNRFFDMLLWTIGLLPLIEGRSRMLVAGIRSYWENRLLW